MKRSITARLLASQKPKDIPYQIHDTGCRGFIWRCQPSGVQSFYFQYKSPTGKRYKLLIGRTDEVSLPDAREKAEGYRMALNRGEDPAAALEEAKAKLTLREFIEGPYREWAVANLKSHKTTLGRLVYGFTSLLDRQLDTLSAFDFEKNRQARLKSTPKSEGKHAPTKGATINRDQAHMRAALTRAVRWGHMAINPLVGITKSREDRNATIRPMTTKEEADVLDVFRARRDTLVRRLKAEALKQGRKPPPVPHFLDYFEPLVLVSVDCGLRRGEAQGLLWSDVNLPGGKLTVRGEGAKSSQSRVIPLSPRVKVALAEWLKQSERTDAVFPAATVDSIRAKWIVLLKAAKVNGLRWHDLRHTFGTRMVMAGVALPIIQKLMGHSSITTTARYLHATDEDARKAVALVAKSVARAKK